MSGATMPDDRIEQLYQEMFAKLYQYALRITSNPSLAEEAVQNTFCIACSKKDSLFSSDNPRGWLMNTLKNVIRNMLRDRAKLAISVLDIMEENNISSTDEVNIDVLYSDISNNEDFQLLKWIALDKYSIREISDNIGISMEACKKRVQRAKKRLQGHIKNNI